MGSRADPPCELDTAILEVNARTERPDLEMVGECPEKHSLDCGRAVAVAHAMKSVISRDIDGDEKTVLRDGDTGGQCNESREPQYPR